MTDRGFQQEIEKFLSFIIKNIFFVFFFISLVVVNCEVQKKTSLYNFIKYKTFKVKEWATGFTEVFFYLKIYIQLIEMIRKSIDINQKAESSWGGLSRIEYTLHPLVDSAFDLVV